MINRVFTYVLAGVLATLITTHVAVAQDGLVTDRARVCMVNDAVQAKAGEPITHGGKTYYGCCAMCAEKIRTEPDRFTKSVDQVDGRIVDKADAVMHVLSGSVYYFRTEENRLKFSSRPNDFLTQGQVEE